MILNLILFALILLSASVNSPAVAHPLVRDSYSSTPTSQNSSQSSCESVFSPNSMAHDKMHIVSNPLQDSMSLNDDSTDELLSLSQIVHARVYDEGKAVPNSEHQEYFRLLSQLIELAEKRLKENKIGYSRVSRDRNDPLKEFDYFVIKPLGHTERTVPTDLAAQERSAPLNQLATGLARSHIRLVIDPIRNAFEEVNGQLVLAEATLFTSVNALVTGARLDSTTIHELTHFGSLLIHPFKLKQKLLYNVTDNKPVSKNVTYAGSFFIDEMRAHTIQTLYELHLSRMFEKEHDRELINRNTLRLREFITRTESIVNAILVEAQTLRTLSTPPSARALYSENGVVVELNENLSITASGKALSYSTKGFGTLTVIGAPVPTELVPLILARRSLTRTHASELARAAIENMTLLDELKDWLTKLNQQLTLVEKEVVQNKNRDQLIRAYRDLAVMFKKEETK